MTLQPSRVFTGWEPKVISHEGLFQSEQSLDYRSLVCQRWIPMGKFLHLGSNPVVLMSSPYHVYYTTLSILLKLKGGIVRRHWHRCLSDRHCKWWRQSQVRWVPWHFGKSMPDLNQGQSFLGFSQLLPHRNVDTEMQIFPHKDTSQSLKKMLATNTNGLERLKLAYWEDKELGIWDGKKQQGEAERWGQLLENLDCHIQGAYRLSSRSEWSPNTLRKKRHQLERVTITFAVDGSRSEGRTMLKT